MGLLYFVSERSPILEKYFCVMLSSDFKPKRLTIEAIESSTEIRRWLSQFREETKPTAISMLLHLNFISRDLYSRWFHKCLASLPSDKIYALYAVRKLQTASKLWNEKGVVANRPGTTLGSEDLVYSLIANVVRGDKTTYFDHPSLSDLQTQGIRDIILVDDTIGSGKRISDFILSMQKNPSFLSWWSFGLVHIHILSFCRSAESESVIVHNTLGSDHPTRKFRKSYKLHFYSEHVYSRNSLVQRWGHQAANIVDLCDEITHVQRWARYGYGGVMANTAFYHSVPNNIPGLLWFEHDGWQALFTGRTLPTWTVQLLEGRQVKKQTDRIVNNYDPKIIYLLALIKSGNRNADTLALKLGCERSFAKKLLAFAQELNLISVHKRLTTSGMDVLMRATRPRPLPKYDRSLYIPTSWSIGQAIVQPPSEKKSSFSNLADFAEAEALANGDDGQASLERSDAWSATPPFSVMPQSPSTPRKSHDANGPQGSKDW